MSGYFQFSHRRLDVYHVAVQFVTFVDRIPPRWFAGRADRRVQLARAADSIVLNIAEGASQAPSKAKFNHYRIALASAGECDAILQLLAARRCPVSAGHKLLARVGAMLWNMRE